MLKAGDPTQMGGYAYAADNPVANSDPTGLSSGGDGTPPNPCGIDAPATCDPTGAGGPNGGYTPPAPGGGTGGTGYTGLGPGGSRGRSRERRSEISRVAGGVQFFLQFYGFGSSGIVNAAQNDAVWFQVCQQNPGLCPSSMYLTLGGHSCLEALPPRFSGRCILHRPGRGWPG